MMIGIPSSVTAAPSPSQAVGCIVSSHANRVRLAEAGSSKAEPPCFSQR